MERLKTIYRFKILLPLLFSSFFVHGNEFPEGFSRKLIADNLNPVSMTIAPDGRIFLAEKDGRLRVIENDNILPDPFITLEVDDFNERGLSGIALDPNFENNNYLYVYYSIKGKNFNRLSRLTASGNFAVPGSEKILMEMDELSWTVHNGGAMGFGKDGKLYLATGDGANSKNAQSLNSLLGKVLRINSDGTIPEDNPFYAKTEGKYKAIWALGFRNPFSFDIDPLSGKILLNDVGLLTFEEVNVVEKGKNYGWPIVEGFLKSQTAPLNYKDPLYSYDRNSGCAVIGAAFYNPINPSFPERYRNNFFFADYCNGYIKILNPDNGEVLETFAVGIVRPLSIDFNKDGEMYYLERESPTSASDEVDVTSTNRGKLWKVSYIGDGPPVISNEPSNTLVSVGEDAKFQIYVSGSDPLTFSWFKNDALIGDENQSVLVIKNLQKSDSGNVYHCKVTNTFGSVTSQKAVISVTSNTRPQPAFTFPEITYSYKAGDTLFFEGSAIDGEDGFLDSLAMEFWIDFHHNEHTHPAMPSIKNVSSGYYVIPTDGESSDNVFYRIYFKVKDKEGLSKTIFRDILPQKSELKVFSIPENLKINLDGQYLESPSSVVSVVGLKRTLEAPLKFDVGKNVYFFKEWSNGNTDRFLSFSMPDTTVLISAVYEALPEGYGVGLAGRYYNNIDFNSDPKMIRIDPTIDFNWNFDSPNSQLISSDNFSVIWTGRVIPYRSGNYTFILDCDDGVRLWIDKELIIDKWVYGREVYTGIKDLTRLRSYEIRLEYHEQVVGAKVLLKWKSDEVEEQIIPKNQLYPDENFFGPNPFIISPYKNETYIGDTLFFKGYGLTSSNDTLPASSSRWWIDFYHDGKIDRVMEITDDINSGIYIIDSIGNKCTTSDCKYRIYYRVSYENGSGKTINKDIFLQEKPLGVEELPYSNITIFPIPSKDILNIHFKGYYEKDLELHVFSVTGQTLFIKKYKIYDDLKSIELDLRSFSSGVYIINLRGRKLDYYKKIIKD